MFIGVMVPPMLASRRFDFRETVVPHMPKGMDLGFVISQQASQQLMTALLVENSTFHDIFLVDSYYEGVGNQDVPLKMRSWVHLVAAFGKRYQFYARLDSDSVLQPVGLFQRFHQAPHSMFMWCRVGWGGNVPECGGAAIVISADLADSIIQNMPPAVPEHDDKAITAWVRQATNMRANLCFAVDHEILNIAQGGQAWPEFQKWRHAFTNISLVMHGSKEEADFLFIWERTLPFIKAWRSCIASEYEATGCDQLRNFSASPRCANLTHGGGPPEW